MSDDNNDADFKPGYKNPPKNSRFKKGESGNPKGRPKGSTDIDQIFERLLRKKVTVREGDAVANVSKLEAIAMQRVNKAMKGGFKETEHILAMTKRFNSNPGGFKIIIQHVRPDRTEKDHGAVSAKKDNDSDVET